MSDYNQKYNKDDVFIRSMIVCLLAEMNKKLYIYNRLDDGSVQKVDIPCLYSITGQERFLKDEFYYDALQQGKALGDYERVPRCMINLTSFSINQAEQTNKYNRTKIVRESQGILRTLYLNVEWVPVTLSFDCRVICANNIELFKVTEMIVSKIYKNNNYFKVDFGMFNVDACLSVPPDYNHELPQEFGLNEKKEFSTSFSVEMKSFIPAFEHGLLMYEIDELLLQVPKEAKGIIEYRPDEFGNWGMRAGGVMETIIESAYNHPTEKPTLKSNTHQVPMRVKSLDDLKKKDIEEDLIVRKITK
jgi:hypothetical protein